MSKRYADLFAVSIEELGLSVKAFNVLRWQGITTIGDCLVFYYHHIHNDHRISLFPGRVITFMYSEVEPKMKQRGYWSFLEDNTMWHDLKRHKIEPRMIVTWQGKDQDLGQISFEDFNFSVRVFDSIRRVGLRSVGDLINLFIFNERYSERRQETPETPDSYANRKYIFDEIEQKLKEHGYWSLVTNLN